VALKRISTASSVEDACRESDFLIEAVPGRNGAEARLYTLFDKFAKPNAVLASNTSSLSIAEMAEMISGRNCASECTSSICAQKCV